MEDLRRRTRVISLLNFPTPTGNSFPRWTRTSARMGRIERFALAAEMIENDDTSRSQSQTPASAASTSSSHGTA